MSLPREELLAADLPPAEAIGAALGSEWWARVVLFGGLLGLISTWNAIYYGATRLVYALGRAHLIPAAFGRVHPVHRTPHVAIGFVGLIGAAGAFLGREAILPIVNIGAIIIAALFAAISYGVIRLRRQLPDQPRPVRIRGVPWLPAVAAVFAAAMLILSFLSPLEDADGMPVEWWALLAWGVLGTVFWFGARRTRDALTGEQRHARLLNEDDGAHSSSGN